MQCIMEILEDLADVLVDYLGFDYELFYQSDDVLWLDDLVCFIVEDFEKINVSFNVNIEPAEAAKIVHVIVESGFDIEIYESFLMHNKKLYFKKPCGFWCNDSNEDECEKLLYSMNYN